MVETTSFAIVDASAEGHFCPYTQPSVGKNLISCIAWIGRYKNMIIE